MTFVLLGHQRLYCVRYCWVVARCFYIAQACEAAKKWKEALALYERVLFYATDSLKAYEKVNGPDKDQVRTRK